MDAIEQVLLYHVVPGREDHRGHGPRPTARSCTTAQGGTVTVNVRTPRGPVITLVDQDRNDRNPRVILSQVDINKGNKQIAHGISRVLRPMDL